MIALAANGFSASGLTIGNMTFTYVELAIALAVVLIVIVAIFAFRKNTKSQMRVSQYMDNESDTFNVVGMENYIKKNKRKFANPTLVVAKINNLESMYEHYPNKEKLMFAIANTFLVGLEKKEMAGRIDVDKFLIIYDAKPREMVAGLCHQIEERLVEKEFDGYGKYDFSLNFGVYEGPELKEVGQDIHKTVSALMYSKIRDKNISYYGEEVSVSLQREQRMNEMKNAALADKKFVSYIQPKVSLKTGQVIGGEILCRWVDDEGKPMFYPNEFIPLFEQNGFVRKIDFLMLENACSLAQTLIQRGHTDIVISMNFSRYNFDSPTFVQDVIDVVKNYNVRNENIEIEVTEAAIINTGAKISNAIMDLRNHGFRVAMDDFGKEASSLGFLSTNSFDTIKMDMIFFRDRLRTDKNKIIVKGMIETLENLNFETVCEGIEDVDTLDVLATMSTDVIIQGYVISKPVPLSEFDAFVESKYEFNYPDPKLQQNIEYVYETVEEPTSNNQTEWKNEVLQEMKYKKAEPSEIDKLRAEIEDLKRQKREKDEIDSLRRELNELRGEILEEPEEEVIYVEEEPDTDYEDEVSVLYDQLDKERQEREELEAMLASIKNGGDDLDEEVDESLEEEIEKEADDNLNLDVDSIGDDEDEDLDDEDDTEPELTQDEVERIIMDYQRKYNDDWNLHAKNELSNYAELLKGLKYYQEHQTPKTLVGKAKRANETQKKIYNIVKNELLKYDGVTNTLTKNFDCFYINRRLIAKMSFTLTKIRIYLAVDPSKYPERQFPHRDVSNKKAHARTPYYALLSSQLSVRRIQKVITDMMNNNALTVNDSYKPLDYAIKFKFMKKD